MRLLFILGLFFILIFAASVAFADGQRAMDQTNDGSYSAQAVASGASTSGNNEDESSVNPDNWSDIETFQNLQDNDNLDF